MTILGLGGLRHNPACALLRDGELAAAIEESKLARYVEPRQWPADSIAHALALGSVRPEQVDMVCLVRPFAGAGERLTLLVRDRFPKAEIVTLDHHLAHAASAYYPSPFEDAVVLTLDRAGDVRSGARWHAHGTDLQLERELALPDSLGALYGRVTALLGFQSAEDEHKTQWLSAAGEDRFESLFADLLPLSGGFPRVNRTYFDADRLSSGGFSESWYRALGLRDGEPVPEALKPSIATSLQRALERTVAAMLGEAPRVCLAGGVAYNALLVSSLERDRQVFVQPAAGNSGTALGAVLYAWHVLHRQSRRVALPTLCLGPHYDAEAIKKVLENCKLRFRLLLTSDEMITATLGALGSQRIVAWMQGRMEFGPRALGNRSLLASPLDPYSTENLNVFIKRREPFRKFAASVPADAASEFFEVGPNARFLATVGRVRPAHRKTFESAILGDDLVRVHVVEEAENPLYHRLLREAGRTTGLPVLYNTSFNLFGDPLVCSPRDAVRSFYSSGVDALCVGNFLIEK